MNEIPELDESVNPDEIYLRKKTEEEAEAESLRQGKAMLEMVQSEGWKEYKLAVQSLVIETQQRLQTALIKKLPNIDPVALAAQIEAYGNMIDLAENKARVYTDQVNGKSREPT